MQLKLEKRNNQYVQRKQFLKQWTLKVHENSLSMKSSTSKENQDKARNQCKTNIKESMKRWRQEEKNSTKAINFPIKLNIKSIKPLNKLQNQMQK